MTNVEKEDELWNSWTSCSEAAIILDGRKLNDVFTSIRSQLEFLRRQQQKMSEDMSNFNYHNHRKSNEAAKERVSEPASNFIQEFQSPSSSHANLKGSFAATHAPPPALLDADELQIILDRIHALETDVRKHDAFGERIDRLEANVNSKFHTLQTQMEKLTARVETNSAMSALYEKKFFDLEKQFTEKIHHLTASFDDKLGVLQQSSDEGFRANESVTNALRDVVQVNELRLKKVEKDAVKNADHIRELQETIDYFPVKYLDNIRNDIVELYMVKASKDDLGHKFDTTAAVKKADQEEVVRLEQHAIELTRRLDLLTKELHDGFGTVDTKMEKRIDKVAHWCLKHLRKEMRERNFEHGDEPREGTDIGRVRCLVCDQPVTQLRETDIVHGGPPMKNVIKPHHIQPGAPGGQHQQLGTMNGSNNNNQMTAHGQYNQMHTRPRSASPPPTRGRGFGTGSTPQVPESPTKRTTIVPGTLPSVNTGRQQTTTTHSKLVKLGAQPIVGASNPAGTAVPTETSASPSGGGGGGTFTDEVDPAEDFNYRVETDVGTQQQQQHQQQHQQRRSPNPADDSPLRIAHAAPVHSRDPTATTVTAATLSVSASQPALQQQVHQFHVQQNQQDNANYFRDLEERFTGGRRQNNTGAMKQLNYKYDSATSARPQTAPNKRGMSGSKLKSNSTRPMAFEEA